MRSSDKCSADDRISVVVVDIQAVVRIGVRSIIENSEKFAVQSNLETVKEIIEYCEREKPELIVVDCFLVDQGPGIIRKIRDCSPNSNVLVLTMTEDPIDIQAALYEGAIGYVSKNASEKVLTEAITQTARGNSYIPKAMISSLVGKFNSRQNKSNGFGLTRREIEILSGIIKGMTNKEMARLLKLSVRTIEAHRSNIRTKTSAKTNAKLFQVARHLELIDDGESRRIGNVL